MNAKVPNVKQQQQQQQQSKQQQNQQSLQLKKKQPSTTTTTNPNTHKTNYNSKPIKMTTTSGFVAPNANVKSTSAADANLNHTATEAKEVEAVDVASDAFYCGSGTQHIQQQRVAATTAITEDPQPPPRAAPRGNPPTPKPRSVLPPTTTLMTTITPAPTATATTATALINSSSVATSKATTATPMQHATVNALKMTENVEPHTTPRSKQRLIKVDFSLLQLASCACQWSCTQYYLLHMWK